MRFYESHGSRGFNRATGSMRMKPDRDQETACPDSQALALATVPARALQSLLMMM